MSSSNQNIPNQPTQVQQNAKDGQKQGASAQTGGTSGTSTQSGGTSGSRSSDNASETGNMGSQPKNEQGNTGSKGAADVKQPMGSDDKVSASNTSGNRK